MVNLQRLPVREDVQDLKAQLARDLNILSIDVTEYAEYPTAEEVRYALHVTMLLHANKVIDYLKSNGNSTFKKRFNLS